MKHLIHLTASRLKTQWASLFLLCFLGISTLQARPTFIQDNSQTLALDYFVTITYRGIDEPGFSCSGTGGSSTRTYVQLIFGGSYPLYSELSREIEVTPDVNGNGTFVFRLPPNTSYSLIRAVITYDCPLFNHYSAEISAPFAISTTPIARPLNLSATDDAGSGSTLSTIKLEWEKGTDVPYAKVGYNIFREGTLIETQLPGDTSYTYIDSFLNANTPYNYEVKTYTNDPGQFYVLSFFRGNVGVHESTPASDAGNTASLDLLVSQGAFTNKVKLSWNNVSISADEIRVQRSIPPSSSSFEELAILSKHATAFTDTDPIPGYEYTYQVSPLDGQGNPRQVVDEKGYSLPDGVVRGKVSALGGAGVAGISICITPLSAVSPAGKLAVPASGYCSTTDAAGDYEVRGIYYFDQATFNVVPSYPAHVFGPASTQITLDLNSNIFSGINFTDSSSISILGQVKFPPAAHFGASGSDIGIKDVAIILDSLDRGIRTDMNGNWSYAVTNPGNYKFFPRFEDHPFVAAGTFPGSISGDMASVSVTDQDISGVNFIDQKTDTMTIRIQDACGAPLPVSPSTATPRARITHDGGPAFFDLTVAVSGGGVAKVALPASQFKTQVLSTPSFMDANVEAQLTATTLPFDLSTTDSVKIYTRDTIQVTRPGQTVIVGGVTTTLPPVVFDSISVDSFYKKLRPQADFVYFGPFDIHIDFEKAGAEVFKGCSATGLATGDSIILMETFRNYVLDIEIIDQYSGCEVDTGQILIYDYVGDKENSAISIPIQAGHAFYREEPGAPNIASGGAEPYQKLFYVSVSAGVRAPQGEGWYILLQGTKELTPTFTSRSPEFPDLIVHDPPGDNSYAWVEKGSSYTTFSSTQYELSGSGGVFVDMILGSKVNTSIGLGGGTITSVGAGGTLTFGLQAGRENFDKASYASTYTFNENFSTSDDPLFTGYDGDVYIGKATNQLFSIAKVLEFDESTCTASVTDKPNLAIGGVATTFIYTEKHIKGVLIPQFKYLIDILKTEAAKEPSASRQKQLIAEADSFRIDSANWSHFIAKNAYNRDTAAVYVRNQSFSAGANYQKVENRESASTSSYEYTEFVDTDLSLGVAWVTDGSGLWTEGNAGFAATFRHSFTKEEGSETGGSFEVGYVLADKDIGDFFSVDILTDTAYNVPAFRLFGGTSSCPQEPGTQARDRANLNIFPPRIDNVPKGGTAIFTVQMINESESQETREYQLRVIPQSNPGGAVVTMGGQNISNKTISYVLDAFQSSEVDLKVEAGPRAANYDSIAIMMFPPCEYELWENNGSLINGDTFYISVNFESECSSVALVNPTDNWLVNANNNDLLTVDFSGYDLNNPFLESISLEYQPKNQGWIEGPLIPRDSLKDLLYREFWDVSGLADGNYKIRARATCNERKGYTLSSSTSGLIDRNSIAPFGIPTPSDGFLRLGQLISVTFDKDIDCGFTDATPTYSPNISLMRTDDNTLIPLQVQCSENDDQINLIPAINLFNMPDLKDVLLIARVQGIQDPQGNVQKYPVEWAFKVNAAPVFWDPDSLAQKGNTGKVNTITAKLKNQAVLTKAFEISDFPVWLSPSILSGSVLSNGDFEIAFTVDPSLPPGVYRDTVTAMIDGWPEYLDITYESLATPPNWTVDPGKYTYSMSMILAVSLDQTNTNLSRDDRDMVAAIFNGEIRGVGRLEYVSRFNKYMAFMTVYSNIPANEEISFSMWRASTGVEHVAKETYYFASEQVYGQINNPAVLHTDGVFQVIPLQQGWNWVSLNVSNSDMTVHNLLNSLASPEVGNDITVKRKDGNTATYTQIATPIIFSNQWAGNLAQLDNEQAYLIHLSNAPDTLRIPGQPITNFSNINVLSGWNWIGFQPQSAQPIKNALSSVNLRNLDLIKGHEAFSQYHKGSKTWFGPLQFMEPGKGYKLKLKTGVNYNDLTYSRLGLKDFQVDHTLYESSMTVIGSVGEFELKSESKSERLLVGAFIDDTCRGYGFVEYVEFLKAYRIIFSMAGNASDIGRAVTFKLYDTQSGQEFMPDKEPEIYISDRILGDMMEPYVLFENLVLPEAGYLLEQNYPNPYDSKTNIRFILPQTEQVKLTVFDSFGKIVKVLIEEELNAGEHTAVLDAAHLPSGIYHYTIQAGEYRASRKMVKF